MSELKIPKNSLWKRASTSAIREGAETCKKACRITQQKATCEETAEDKAWAENGKGADVPAEERVVSFMYPRDGCANADHSSSSFLNRLI